MESEIQNENQSGKPWSPYALTALMLVLGLFIFSLIGLRGTIGGRPAETDYQTVYSGDGTLKLYYLTQFSAFRFPQPQMPQRRNYLQSAYVSYQRAIDVKYPSPGAIRRALVVEHALKKGDDARLILLLTSPGAVKDLPKQDVATLRSEAKMWQSIYFGHPSPAETNDYAARIKRINLGTAQWLALNQLYSAVGNQTLAQQTLQQARSRAFVSFAILVAMAFFLFLAGIAGIVFLILFLVNSEKWLVEWPKPSTVPSDALFKGFVVYMAMYWVLMFASLFMHRWIQNMPSQKLLVYYAYWTSLGTAFIGIVSLVALDFLVKKTGHSLRDIGLTLQDFGKNVLWGIAGYCAMLPIFLVVVIMWSSFLRRFFPNQSMPENPITRLFTSGNPLVVVLALVAASVFAPFFEEIFFRGTLYSGLKSKLSMLAAVVIAAVVFSILHPFPTSFLPIFAIGAVFCLMFQSRRSLVPSMVAHAIHNTVTFLMIYFLLM